MATRNQHYIPLLYLKRFADSDGKLNVKDLIRKKECKMMPDAICYQRDLYEVKDDNGKRYKVNYIENMFNIFESFISSQFDNFLKRINENESIDNFKLSEEDDVLFAFFITLQLIRHPKFKKFLNECLERKSIENSIFFKDIFYVCMSFSNNVFQDIIQDICTDDDYNKLSEGKNLLDEVCSYLVSNCYFSIVMSENRETKFITSDDIIVKDPFGDVKYYFPLTPYIGIIASEFSELSESKAERIIYITDAIVKGLNLEVESNAERFIIY